MRIPPTKRLIPQSDLVSTHGASRTAGRDGSLLGLFKRAGVALWRGLEAQGQARARRELRMLADRWAPRDPDVARELRAASEFDVLLHTRTQAPAQAHSTPAGLAVSGV